MSSVWEEISYRWRMSVLGKQDEEVRIISGNGLD